MTLDRILLAVLPAAAGLLIAAVGVLGLRERLPRNRFAGVRTRATLRSDEAFRVGNRVAGLPVITAGAVSLVGGAVGLAMPSGGGAVVAALIGLVGMALIAGAGGVLGHRAATAVPEPKPEPPAGCGGCGCGNCGISKLKGSAASSA